MALVRPPRCIVDTNISSPIFSLDGLFYSPSRLTKSLQTLPQRGMRALLQSHSTKVAELPLVRLTHVQMSDTVTVYLYKKYFLVWCGPSILERHPPTPPVLYRGSSMLTGRATFNRLIETGSVCIQIKRGAVLSFNSTVVTALSVVKIPNVSRSKGSRPSCTPFPYIIQFEWSIQEISQVCSQKKISTYCRIVCFI